MTESESARSAPELDLATVAGATVTDHDCPTCEGVGVVPTHLNYWGMQEDDTCAHCAGTGQIARRQEAATLTCALCHEVFPWREFARHECPYAD